jgi:hypothetical protein
MSGGDGEVQGARDVGRTLALAGDVGQVHAVAREADHAAVGHVEGEQLAGGGEDQGALAVGGAGNPRVGGELVGGEGAVDEDGDARLTGVVLADGDRGAVGSLGEGGDPAQRRALALRGDDAAQVAFVDPVGGADPERAVAAGAQGGDLAAEGGRLPAAFADAKEAGARADPDGVARRLRVDGEGAQVVDGGRQGLGRRGHELDAIELEVDPADAGVGGEPDPAARLDGEGAHAVAAQPLGLAQPAALALARLPEIQPL